jgi:hypothetical protein
MVVDTPTRRCAFWLAQALVGAGLSAFEMMHRMGSISCDEVGPEIRQPFDEKPEWMCLIDLGMGAGQSPARRWRRSSPKPARRGWSQTG